MVVLPSSTQPASRTRAAIGESSVFGVVSPIATPIGAGSPLLTTFSLRVIGTPSSGDSGVPSRQRASAAFAAARAPSWCTR